jgi:Flp pilus assembly protein TadD
MPVKSAAPLPPLVAVRQMIERGDLTQAEARLEEYLERQPDSREGRELLLGLMLRGDRLQAAMTQLELGLRHHPGHPAFLLIKARLLIRQGQGDAARELLADHHQSGRATAEMLQMLGALYQQQQRYAAAAETYRELTRLRPDSGPAWAGLAISLDAAGEAGAGSAYRRALRLGGLPRAAADYAGQRLAALGGSDG